MGGGTRNGPPRAAAGRPALARSIDLVRSQPAAPDANWPVLASVWAIPALLPGCLKRFFEGLASVIDSDRGFCANYVLQSYFGLPFCASVFGCLRRSKDPVVLSIA